MHTTELIAFSAANNNNIMVIEDELTTATTTHSKETNDFKEMQQESRQKEQQQQQLQQPVLRLPPFFKAAAPVSSTTERQQQQQQQLASGFLVPTASSAATAEPSFSFSSTYSLFPPTSSSSSLDFTAAWVASTPFSAAATTPFSTTSAAIAAADRPLHFLKPKVASTASAPSGSFGKSRGPITTASMIGATHQPRQSNSNGGNTGCITGGRRQSPVFLQNHQPQFVTPSVGVFRVPNNNNNADAFATTPPFFVPSVSVVSDSFGNNKFTYPLYNRSPATAANNHLGRHWKQMGCHTRQYLQPSIPLPSTTRLASAAAKQLRGASLGGPPGSLSPLTPNKSWAQVVASSTPQQMKDNQQQQQQQQQPMSTSVTGVENAGEKQQQQQQQQSRASAMPPPPPAAPPPPVFIAPGVGVVKPARSASLRGLTGLGASTSSNRDFKSLLLRLRTAMDKEREKWRPRSLTGGGGAAAVAVQGNENHEINASAQRSNGVKTRDVAAINGQQRDECIFWLAWILRKFRFSAETMSLSVSLFDAVVSSSSFGSSSSALLVTSGNCKVVALICMLLSAKFSEEDADVPTTKDLLSASEIGVDAGGVEVTVEAALKMERAILTTLDWDLNRPTPLKFLEILHTLLMCHQPQLLEDVALGLTPTKHLERLTWKMQRIVANHQLALSYRPAVLAVALLSVDLESIGVSDWQLVSTTLEKICQIGSGSSAGSGCGEDRHKLARCKNLINRLLVGDRKGLSNNGTVATTAMARPSAGGGGGGLTRKVTTDSAEDPEKKRSMTKLKRKHVPSESGGGAVNVASTAASTATASSTDVTSASSSCSSASSKTTLKRVFNIAESPTCKSEARSEEEAAANRGGIAVAGRFQALHGGLCINIY